MSAWTVGVCAVCLAAALASDIEFPAGDGDNLEIPLDLMRKLSTLENITEFQDFVDAQSQEDFGTDIINRFGEEIERKAATVPKNAVCVPELRVVQLVERRDPSLLYFPSCTRVERCGGCCSSELLSCQPTDSELVNYMVYVSSLGSSGKFKVKEKIIVSVEKHLACRCGCTVKEEDCSKLQRYEEDNCRCSCINRDEEKKCRSQNTTKLWDPSTCACTCRELRQCSSGYFYDQNTCACSEMRTRRRHVTSEDSRLLGGPTPRPEPLPVLPLRSTAPAHDQDTRP
ncbi:balbiani ring protein 3-like [Bacillus rossius redtenbacheri]|uniref:balbiani ring protein 3-like n=1 Tax=Bacillus rossius redtenbacheri TaxID=93214 RepID=UPI002FDE6737